MPDPGHKAISTYMRTLLRYYEEEISGEAYFYGLAEHFSEREKTILLARIERHAATAVEPLLEKYGLEPADEAALEREGQSHVGLHQSYDWEQFMTYIIERYPLYTEDFLALERMAPAEDQATLKKLTDHEVAVIDFAKKELAGEADSVELLLQYLD